jgi:hypothetical protein
MDPQRRAALLQRRDDLRRGIDRAGQLYGLEDIKAALEAAGEPHQILYADEAPQGWSPQWIPAGWSRIPWHLVPPAEETWFRRDEAARDEAVVSALSRLAGEQDSLLLIVEGRAASFRIPRAVVERHARVILDTGWGPLWITAPPDQWLIEVSKEDVRVGDTPVGGGVVAEGTTSVSPLTEALDQEGVPYLLFDEEDEERPALPEGPRGAAMPRLRLTLGAEDGAGLHGAVLGFLAERVTGEGPVEVILRTSRLQLGRTGLERHLEAVLGVDVDINLSAPGADWLLAIRRRLTRTWLNGIG